MTFRCLVVLTLVVCNEVALQAATVNVNTVIELVDAVNNGAPGDTVQIAPGTYALSAAQRLTPRDGMTIRGAGIDQTVIRPVDSWDPGTDGLPNERDAGKAVREAFLFNLENTGHVTISYMTTRADRLHGHMLLVSNRDTTLSHMKLIEGRWVGIQTFRQRGIVVHDCIFEDAGGKVRWMGGSIFQTGTQGGEYYNNHMYRTGDKKYVGFKARGDEKNIRIHHNTVEIGHDFSLEWPHQSCHFIEIDHNMFMMTLSIPKWQGGTVPEGGYSFWIHHNWLRRSYAIELARNGLSVDHNLFDFATDADYGNLLCDFGKQPVKGPIVFHDNRIKNPGRGLFWHRGPAAYREFRFYNNEVKAHTTITPRLEGFFGFSKGDNDYQTIEIRNNIIECIGIARPLFRQAQSYAAVVENNTLINVSDTDEYANPDTGDPRGLTDALNFCCGVNGEFEVTGWKGRRADVSVKAADTGRIWSEPVFVFPADAGVVDVTRAPYGAKGDGLTDDTQAIQRALDDHPSSDKIIYLPNGSYIISDTLKWPAGAHGGQAQKRVILQGQSTEGTVLKLQNSTPGFTDATRPKALIWTGARPAQRFRNGIRTLTIHVGRGNRGAIGAQYIANNQGSVRDLRIISEDGGGRIGLDLGYTNEQGPCLIKSVEVRGFGVGIRTKHAVDSVTLESVRLRDQTEVGLLNEGQCLSMADFTSVNRVPAIKNLGSPSLITLEAGWVSGQGPAGIINSGSLLVSNTTIQGYGTGIDNDQGHEADAPCGRIDEWASHPVSTLFETEKKTLCLPIKPTPVCPLIDLDQWAGPHQFGGRGDDNEDDSRAVQRAIDSGARVIYFPYGTWIMDGMVEVRGRVERLTAFEGRLRGKGTIKVADGSASTVFIDRMDLIYQSLNIEHATQRTLVFSGITLGKGRFTCQPEAGDLFLEDVCGGPWCFTRQNVWARQLNPESHVTKIVNDGGRLWILGLKTERGGTLIETRNGGQTEVFGGFCYANTGDEKPPMFINDRSSLSVSIGEMVIRQQPFRTVVVETQGAETRRLTMDDLPDRGGGSMVPLYVGRCE
jgi:hypothetical protein